MSTVLSTRLLSEDQKRTLQDAHIVVEEYNAIAIDLIDFELPKGFTYFIFTSKNGVKSFLRYLTDKPQLRMSEISCFCVGQKTKSFLEENELKVIKMTENALELANFIAKRYKKEHFLIFTGNRNRPDLRMILSKESILFKEIEVYKTSLVPQRHNQKFQGILFYSPSGVESFTRENVIGNTPVFCIGETTAREARKYSEHVNVAEKPTVDSVIEMLIKKLPTLLKQ
ncbi:uroporphyrinogen-III synthase [uncultured Muriicola sp.]|uniref:uroporphyrinogen-III synthase n=1 Tax=uncultured Muriicola sp. TaxID=1583102 RepID=UPI0026161BA1|nr:uroporphyrinogen-III synthase [uncultured Muriicola sp.]